EAAPDLALDERPEPALLLLRGAVVEEELHVPGVRRLDVEDVVADHAAAEHLADQREIAERQPAAPPIPVACGAPGGPSPGPARAGGRSPARRRRSPAPAPAARR